MNICACIGPQNGEPLCPCRMSTVRVVNGRYVETIDHGPVRPHHPMPRMTGGITHAPDSPLLRSQDDFGRRYASRTHMLDSGPVKPVDPTIAAEDPA